MILGSSRGRAQWTRVVWRETGVYGSEERAEGTADKIPVLSPSYTAEAIFSWVKHSTPYYFYVTLNPPRVHTVRWVELLSVWSGYKAMSGPYVLSHRSSNLSEVMVRGERKESELKLHSSSKVERINSVSSVSAKQDYKWMDSWILIFPFSGISKSR